MRVRYQYLCISLSSCLVHLDCKQLATAAGATFNEVSDPSLPVGCSSPDDNNAYTMNYVAAATAYDYSNPTS